MFLAGALWCLAGEIKFDFANHGSRIHSTIRQSVPDLSDEISGAAISDGSTMPQSGASFWSLLRQAAFYNTHPGARQI